MSAPSNRSRTSNPAYRDLPAPTRVYIDLTHLGRHVTGLERVSIEQFEKVDFEAAEIHHVRAYGSVSMVLRQQVWLPILALMNPRATFVFPGFPPSPIFALMPARVVMYVHDLFLITRPADLGTKARLYMAWPFALAVSRLRHFLVNSEKTAAELTPFARQDASISLYRPSVRNVFGLEARTRAADRRHEKRPLRLVSLGTVEPRKNYPAAVAILEALAGHGHPDAELHIIGRPGWGDAADAIAGHPRIKVHGYLPAEDVKRVFEEADVYLCTSHDEGLGLPLLEAQYAGLPIVAPDKPVFREVLGASGTFIETSAPDMAATGIAEMTREPGWRERAASAARTNVERWNAQAASDATRARSMFARPLS